MDPERARRPWAAWAGRLGFALSVAASLLAFPSALPWMIAAWLLAYAVQALRKKRAAIVLVSCLMVVLVKRVDGPPGLIVLAALMAAAAACDRWRPAWSRPALVLLAASWGFMAWEWDQAVHTDRRPALDPSRPVVCIGDSLSAYGFPRLLQQRLRVPLVDFSEAGITLKHGLDRFPEALALNPQAVVIELGGHDFLKGRSRSETRALLEKMILDSRAIGAEVILFEIPRGFVIDGYGGLERELGRKHDLEVVGDGAIRQLVLFSPFTPLGSWTGRNLSDDGLHPNDAGHAWLADRASDALRRVYGDSIFRESP